MERCTSGQQAVGTRIPGVRFHRRRLARAAAGRTGGLLIALALAVPLAFVVAAESWKRFMLVGVVLLLMAVELLNTAIEKLSDHVTPAQHPDIGRVKDMGSAAVGVATAIAGFTWLLAVAERIGLI